MAAARKATILGCGSNVVDVFFRVRAMPVAGTKGYFQDPTKVVEVGIGRGIYGREAINLNKEKYLDHPWYQNNFVEGHPS